MQGLGMVDSTPYWSSVSTRARLALALMTVTAILAVGVQLLLTRLAL